MQAEDLQGHLFYSNAGQISLYDKAIELLIVL